MKYKILLLLALVAVNEAVADSPDKDFSLPIIKIDKAPEIDADLTDPTWAEVARSHAGVFSGWTFWRGTVQKVADQQRIVYAAYDDTNLYLAMQAYATDIYALRGGAGGNPFVGDCLEIFIKPEGEETFHIAIDVEGNINTGLNGKSVDLDTIEFENGFGENYWAMEVAIPWKTIGIEPEKEKVLGFNLGANHSKQYGGAATISWGTLYGDKAPMPTVVLK